MPNHLQTGIYTVTTTFVNSGITCVNSNTTYVSVNPYLQYTITPYVKALLQYLLTISGPAGASGYTWTSSTGNTSFSPNSQDLVLPVLSPDQSGTYVLSASLGPCVTTPVGDPECAKPISYTMTPPGRSICKGDTVLLEVGATGGSEELCL